METELTQPGKTITIAAHREIVERVITALRSRFAELMSLHDMAEIAGLSAFHFNRVFHQTTGITPMQFLYAVRLEKAKRLLLTTSSSITEICYEVGYNSLGTFTYRFTRLVGLSPARLRMLAHYFAAEGFDALMQSEMMNPHDDAPGKDASGRIDCPTPFTGLIFIGLFNRRIPEGSPVGGTLLMKPGSFNLGGLPDGRFFVLAAAMPWSNDPMTYWLPDHASLLVGALPDSLLVRNHRAVSPVNLMLRPTVAIDPPILVALPALLAQRLAATEARADGLEKLAH